MPNKKDKSQQESLRNTLINRIYGVTGDMLDYTNVADDIHLQIGKPGTVTAGEGNITDIVGRSGRRIEALDTEIEDKLTAVGQKLVHTIPYNDRIRLNRELAYILTNMPQLKTTLSTVTEFIMCPDNYSQESCMFNVFLGSASKDIVKSDVEAYLRDARVEDHIKEGVEGSLSLGYLYKAVIPYTNIAERLLARLTDPKSASGREIAKKNKTPKMYGEGLKLMGTDSSKDIDISGAELTTYREMYNSDNTRCEMLRLLSESVNDIVVNGDISTGLKLYGESIKYQDKDEIDPLKVQACALFSESPYNLEDKSVIMFKMHNLLMGHDDIIVDPEVVPKSTLNSMVTYAESNKEGRDENFEKALSALKKQAKSKKKTKPNEMTGCHVYNLDNEKQFPVIIHKEVIGSYVIETYEDINMNKVVASNINNVLGSSKFADVGDYRDNPLVRKEVIRNLSDIITKHMDANFVVDNRRILGSIEKILDEDSMQHCNFRVRFIPRKYLVPFNAKNANNGLGKSELINCRVPAMYWILLNQNMMMNKLFYEKDKIHIQYRTTANQDLYNDRMDAMDIYTNLLPLPSELLDLTRTHASMSGISRLLSPIDNKGNELFRLDRIEGQKPDPTNKDNMEDIEKDIENILGFPLSTLNNANAKYDFATAIIAQDGRLATKIKNYQSHYKEAATELATKIARYETGSDDVFVDVVFQEPKSLPKSIGNENATKFSEEIDNIMLVYYGEDALNEMEPIKKSFIRRKLVKKLYPNIDHTDIMEDIEDEFHVKKEELSIKIGSNNDE